MVRKDFPEGDDGLGREVENLWARFAGVLEAIGRVTGSLDLGTALQEVADGARALTSARYSGVGVIDGSRRVKHFATSGFAPDQRELSESLSEMLAIFGYPNEIQKPLRLADLTHDSLSVGFPENDSPVKVLLGVPLRHLDGCLGSIYLLGKEEGQEFTDEDERLVAMFAAQVAVTVVNALRYEEERQAKAQVETERRRLAALVGSSPVGVLVVDAKTRTFASVNQEAERILGMSPEPGSTLVRYHEVAIYRRADGKKYEGHERPLARALDNGEVVRAEEILFDLPDGRKVNTLVNATPIYSDDGQIVSAVAVVQDMTPLEEVERLRREFLAMVSHELRTPLTTIKGCTGVVLNSSSPPTDSEMVQYFRMIDEQSDNLRDLVNNLLVNNQEH